MTYSTTSTARRPSQAPSDRRPRPAAHDALHAELPTATTPLNLVVIATGTVDHHGRALFDVVISGNRLVAASWVPLRDAASALALARWSNASLVEVTDGLSGAVLHEGTLGEMGGFCSAAEATAAERIAIKREGIRDPRARQRREGLIGGGSGSGRMRTLDRAGYLDRLEAAA